MAASFCHFCKFIDVTGYFVDNMAINNGIVSHLSAQQKIKYYE